MVQMLNEKPKLQSLEIKPFTIGGYEIRTCKYGAYCAFVKEEKDMKETNLEYYKEELKGIFGDYYKQPSKMVDKIADNIDCKVRAFGLWRCTDEILEWMAQPYEEKILNEKERKYLSDVIRPFRKSVTYISKLPFSGNDRQFISIGVMNERGRRECVNLPNFDVGTMYKGMKPNKPYKLEELGL